MTKHKELHIFTFRSLLGNIEKVENDMKDWLKENSNKNIIKTEYVNKGDILFLHIWYYD